MAPSNIGMNKLHMVGTGDSVIPRSRGKGIEGDTHDMVFQVTDASTAPSFNVLYVETPRITLMQAPWVQALQQTFKDTEELLRPLTKIGFPHTTLLDKCKYYDKDLWSKPEGAVLMSGQLKKVVEGHQSGRIHHHLPHDKHVPHGHPPMVEIPPMVFTVASNLLCYWALYRSAQRVTSG